MTHSAAHPLRPRLALMTLCLATLVAQIDTAVVNVATRQIGADLNAGIDMLQWIVDSYNLVYAALLLSGGLLADLYGRRRMFRIGAALFTAASLLCAAAPTASVLVIGRALTGVGAAFFIPASLAIVRVVWPDPAARGRVLGIWSACSGLAMAVGPTLGGVLIDQGGWRAIFLVVVPLSTMALGLVGLCIPESADPEGRHFDGVAQCLGAFALGCVAFGAIETRSAPFVALSALVLGLLALAAFIRVEATKGQTALVPLDILRSPSFGSAAMATAGMTFGMFGILFLLPLAWQDDGRLDALGTGIALLPMALTLVVASPFSGVLSQRYGTRTTAVAGLVTIGAGLIAIAVGGKVDFALVTEAGLALTGLGSGTATGPLVGAAIGAVTAARSGTASALINVARMGGATIGVALLGTVYSLAGAGAHGLSTAMLLSAAVQWTGAIIAWHGMGARKDAAKEIAR